jgi:tetratricopeptide (TPR) repeat protein
MRYIFTLLFLIHYHNIHAQDLGRQKAGNETKRLKQEDTLEIKKLVSIAEKNTETNKDAALQAINRAISMLGRIRYPSFSGLCYKTKADIFYYYSIYDSAVVWYVQSIQQYQIAKDKKRESLSMQYYGVSLVYLNKTDSARKVILQSAKNFEELKEHAFAAKSYRILGIIEQNESKLTKAYEYFNKSNKWAQQSNDTAIQMTILSDFGALYFLVSDFDRSIQYRLASLKLAEAVRDSNMISLLYNAVGIIYKNQNNIIKAEEYYLKALQYTRLGKNEITTYYHANTWATLANIYNTKKEYKKADSLYDSALQIFRRQNEWQDISRVLVNKSGNLLDAGKKKEAYLMITELIKLASEQSINRSLAYGRVKKAEIMISLNPSEALSITGYPDPLKRAEALCIEAMEYFQSAKDIVGESECYNQLISLYKKQKNYYQLSAIQEKLIMLKDSLQAEDKRSEVVRKEMEYFAEKDREAISKDILKEKAARKNILVIAIIAISSLSVILLIYKRKRDILQQKIEFENKVAMADIEMRILRLQMNPHFIFNALNSISHYIQVNEKDKADYYLTRFAKLIRATLENSEFREIPLSKELEMLKMYMDIESQRMAYNFNYQIQVHPDIDPEQTMIPPLILQPFVENSIWHGIASYSSGGMIRIEISHTNEFLNCIVEDNGVGFNKQSSDQSIRRSLGMKITRERILLLNKMKKANATINIIDMEKGARIELKLPYETGDV